MNQDYLRKIIEGVETIKTAPVLFTLKDLTEAVFVLSRPRPMLLWCPSCGERHIDSGEFETKAHHTHACQKCGMVWRPSIVATVGVRFLPGFKNLSE